MKRGGWFTAWGLRLWLAAGGLSAAVGGGLSAQPAVAAESVTLDQAAIAAAYRRSYRYEQAQNYGDAIRALERVRSAYPDGYTVNLRLGWLWYLQGRPVNALDHYEIAIRVAPSAFEPRLGAVLPLLAQGRHADAESMAYTVVSHDAYNYYGNLRLAVALRLQGKGAQARSVVEKMLLLYPTDVVFLSESARLLEATGEAAAAAARWRDVATLDPENPAARAALASLSGGGANGLPE
jgi:tetratricopeptide (TPR) repeat protein